MSLATERAMLVQEVPFIAKYPLPREPHKNLRLKDGLRLAREWGCKLKRVNDNDIRVSHPLVQNGMDAVPVSLSRTDVPQGLCSLIRRVKDATVIHPEYLRSVPMDDRKQLPPLTERLHIPEPAQQIAATIEHLREVRAEKVEAAPPDEDWSSYGSEAEKFFEGLCAHRHYRLHSTDETLVNFDDCKDPFCKQAAVMLDRISFLAGSVQDMEQESGELRKRCGEFGLEVSRLTAQIPKDVEPAKTVTIKEIPTDLLGRTRVIRGEHHTLMADMNRLWAGALAVRSRLGEALMMLCEGQDWSEAVLKAYQELDFSTFRDEIMGMRRAGNTNSMVGARGYTQFVECLQAVRQWRQSQSKRTS